VTGPHWSGLATTDIPPSAVVAPVSAADLIGAALRRCASVASLHGGRSGAVATYLPGRRVTGVRITPTAVFVHLTGAYPAPVAVIDAEVRSAVRPHLAGLALTITIEDYVAGDAAHPASARAPAEEPRTAPIMAEPGAAAGELSAATAPIRATTADLTKEIS